MENVSFEEHIKRSKEILQKLMDPEILLEDGVKFYQEGVKELEEANRLLEKAKLTIKEYKDKESQ